MLARIHRILDEASLARACLRRVEEPIRVLHSTPGLEEATVAAFYKVWTKAGQWRGDANAETWIYRADDPLPRTQKAFEAQRARARTRLPAVTEAATRLLATIAEEYQRVAARLASVKGPLARPAADIRAQLGRLIYKGFLSGTRWEQLAHLPRYLKAMQARLASRTRWKSRCSRYRSPPWIKLHRRQVLDDRRYRALADASKAVLIDLMVLASENEGRVKFDLSDLEFRLHRPRDVMLPHLERLHEVGFIALPASGQTDLLADASTVLPREEESREETEKRRNGGSPQMRDAKEHVARIFNGDEPAAPRRRKP